MAKDNGESVEQFIADKNARQSINLDKYVTEKTGLPTLKDIMQELDKPGRDPRKGVKVFSFNENVKTMDDLQTGMLLPGIVTNITNFGAFVDVGIKENGLVHISQMSEKRIKHPLDVVSVGDVVEVKSTFGRYRKKKDKPHHESVSDAWKGNKWKRNPLALQSAWMKKL